MIHSLNGGVIENYENLTYVWVEIVEVGSNVTSSDSGEKTTQSDNKSNDGTFKGEVSKAWFISPFAKVKCGDRVIVPWGIKDDYKEGVALRVINATKQTAPYPVNRTKEIVKIIK